MLSIFKRYWKNGKFTWYLRYADPRTGEDIRKATKAKTKGEAQFELAKIIQEIGDGSYKEKQRQLKVTFFEIAEDFLTYSRARKRSWEKDETSVKRLKMFLGNIHCRNFKRSMVDSYIALRKEGKEGLGKAANPSTINRELASLKTIFRRAHIDGKIPNNPMAGFKLLEEDNVRDRVLIEEEYQRLLFASPAHLRAILITAWETGMRRNEILYLKWKQINFKEAIIKLDGEGTKTGRSRNIPISPFLMNTIKKLKQINEWVFNYKGQHLTSIRTGFGIACERAGIEDFRFHDLRHCFVTRMRRKGVPDRVIMKITGHQTMECFKRYDTITIDDLKQAVGVEVPESWHFSGTRAD